ncbi:TIGR02450 family Trp-rich protein [Glaciimonas sp. CA11.2]|uniref:TIGR02450 family Trp-rich protein n=1 Tax=unclassified Glaciimonas TaxID=2644401 RepID=UPI002AB477B6|nr:MULTISPECIES: TIGR02450 family Trp-rich protein [unclassified Glaciimonas]MDY7545668.1 TIGR02450 family Trp-rich protein [Glaciimonas sp. CA11.2]MEB0014174.1 TIGR02450 family Trp-rich protein [Glaciimonas sp. Cout2]MEB0084528.1 TIGR02450 family Trp-rich protein [Glaciimonas sp. Gout2]MEB0161486.1 TIGR02450 family Trp-rich protein [Glaciimonas sp. CA11.2]
MHLKASRQLNPKKLLLSKWTATSPSNKEKHFLVTQVVSPEPPAAEIDLVEMEAVHSGRRFSVRWRELADNSQWLQGWQ